MTDIHAPRVSVLIPCYNAGAYLAQAVESVLEQTYQDLEEFLYFRRIHGSNVSLSHEKIGRKDMMALLADAIRQRNKGSN